MPKRSKPLGFIPDYTVSPGANFKAILEKMGITDEAAVKVLARKMGVDPSVIADIANDEETITPSVADLIQRGTGIKAAWWKIVNERYRSNQDSSEPDKGHLALTSETPAKKEPN